MTNWSDLIEFHNTYAEPREGGLLQLVRFPADVRQHLNELARIVSMDSCGAELRFVTTAPRVRFTLIAGDTDADVQVFRGPFHHSTHRFAKGVRTTIELIAPERFADATNAALWSGGWSPEVWRIVPGRAAFEFHHLETFGHPVRPPVADEKPSVTWLAYGSSITHSHLMGYPFHAAHLLHWSLVAKGLSGSCQMEKEASDYLAATATDLKAGIITAELGVNMRGDFTVEEFSVRAAYFVRAIRAANPKIPLVLITAFTNAAHYARIPREEFTRQQGFDAALRELVAKADDSHLHLIEGMDLLPDVSLLNIDILHPSPSGQALMGHLLADRLRALVM